MKIPAFAGLGKLVLIISQSFAMIIWLLKKEPQFEVNSLK